jgi:hypothetical protein
MSINMLQRAALTTSPNFSDQVNGIVRQEALYKGEQVTGDDEAAQAKRERLTQVVRDPAAFGFVVSIVADAAWNMTYDAWANDPPGADGAIMATVQKFWPLLVG